MPRLHATTLLLALTAALSTAHAADQEINIYSARHYQADEALYNDFTQATGIKINRIEAKDDELLERLKTEGEKSPADIFITVDATRLVMAEKLGIFAPFESKIIAERIPARLRTPNWTAFSTRARVIIYNPELVQAEDVQTYEQLADPKLKGKVCTRSGAHPYNVSLGAALIVHDGAEKTGQWAQGLVSNFARSPKGGDTDQIKAVASGECGVALANSYYFLRLMNSGKPEDQKIVDAVRFVWPNQQTWGTHINISGAGILKHAKNREGAIKFLEYLTSDQAQRYFVGSNNEWPAVPSVKIDNPGLDKLGPFKADDTPLGDIAAQVGEAQKVYDRAGYR